MNKGDSKNNESNSNSNSNSNSKNKIRRAPMPIAQRAKQFMPFAALKGLPEALAEQEKIRRPRPALSEERREELDYILSHLDMGDKIVITYYNDGDYKSSFGVFKGVTGGGHSIKVGNVGVPFYDVIDIRVE